VTISGEAKKFTVHQLFARKNGRESLLVFRLPSFRALKFRLNEVKIAIRQLGSPLHIRVDPIILRPHMDKGRDVVKDGLVAESV